MHLPCICHTFSYAFPTFLTLHISNKTPTLRRGRKLQRTIGNEIKSAVAKLRSTAEAITLQKGVKPEEDRIKVVQQPDLANKKAVERRCLKYGPKPKREDVGQSRMAGPAHCRRATNTVRDGVRNPRREDGMAAEDDTSHEIGAEV
jgi:hypothetical protein